MCWQWRYNFLKKKKLYRIRELFEVVLQRTTPAYILVASQVIFPSSTCCPGKICWDDDWGSALRGFLIKKCPVVSTSTPLSESRGQSDLLFKMASISASMVEHSSKVREWLPTVFHSRDLADLIPVSQRPPPNWGAFPGINDHLIRELLKYLQMSLELVSLVSRLYMCVLQDIHVGKQTSWRLQEMLRYSGQTPIPSELPYIYEQANISFHINWFMSMTLSQC